MVDDTIQRQWTLNSPSKALQLLSFVNTPGCGKIFRSIKGTFRRLQSIDICSVKEVVEVCISGCILHNICLLEADKLDDYFDDNDGHVQNIIICHTSGQ